MASTKQEESATIDCEVEGTAEEDLTFEQKHGILYLLGSQAVTNVVNVTCAAVEVAGYVLAVKGYKIPHLRK